MNPLAVDIWLYILLAYLMVSLTIWIVARSVTMALWLYIIWHHGKWSTY